MRQQGGVDAVAGIGHAEHRFVLHAGHADVDVPAFRCVLDRVLQQVHDHLLDARGIRVDPGRLQIESPRMLAHRAAHGESVAHAA
ncbi:hypothetical protein, partial [Bacillus thuringiensis]|uniref:hypothetical protein n=1 Tax=Bacillus thuringiensis TaxID=1428 RepID=UPI001FD73117